MTNLKKFIEIVNEAADYENPLDAPRKDRRPGTRGQLRDEIFGYLDGAQAAINSGDTAQAQELISYVIELVDDNL